MPDNLVRAIIKIFLIDLFSVRNFEISTMFSDFYSIPFRILKANLIKNFELKPILRVSLLTNRMLKTMFTKGYPYLF